MTILLFFPLPLALNTLDPNPSLHLTLATLNSNDRTLNYTSSHDFDTGIVPFALGEKAMYLDGDYSVDEGVDGAMPRAWRPLLLGGREEAGVVVVVYQTPDGKGFKVDVVIGDGKGGSYDVLVGT
jgi:hypothetical protein